MDLENPGEDNIDEELSAFMKEKKMAVASRSVIEILFAILSTFYQSYHLMSWLYSM